MKITLITKEIHDELVRMLDEHPELRLQNNGYEYLSPEVRQRKAAEIARLVGRPRAPAVRHPRAVDRHRLTPQPTP